MGQTALVWVSSIACVNGFLAASNLLQFTVWLSFDLLRELLLSPYDMP
jgi:hypothetical protein